MLDLKGAPSDSPKGDIDEESKSQDAPEEKASEEEFAGLETVVDQDTEEEEDELAQLIKDLEKSDVGRVSENSKKSYGKTRFTSK